MASTIPRVVELKPLIRGDAWDGIGVTFDYGTTDFTGTTAKVHLRTSPDGPLLAALSPSTSTPSLGQFRVVVSLAGSLTALLPIGAIYGDVELSRTFPTLGPKTWCRFKFEVLGDMSHD